MFLANQCAFTFYVYQVNVTPFASFDNMSNPTLPAYHTGDPNGSMDLLQRRLVAFSSSNKYYNIIVKSLLWHKYRYMLLNYCTCCYINLPGYWYGMIMKIHCTYNLIIQNLLMTRSCVYIYIYIYIYYIYVYIDIYGKGEGRLQLPRESIAS